MVLENRIVLPSFQLEINPTINIVMPLVSRHLISACPSLNWCTYINICSLQKVAVICNNFLAMNQGKVFPFFAIITSQVEIPCNDTSTVSKKNESGGPCSITKPKFPVVIITNLLDPEVSVHIETEVLEAANVLHVPSK